MSWITNGIYWRLLLCYPRRLFSLTRRLLAHCTCRYWLTAHVGHWYTRRFLAHCRRLLLAHSTRRFLAHCTLLLLAHRTRRLLAQCTRRLLVCYTRRLVAHCTCRLLALCSVGDWLAAHLGDWLMAIAVVYLLFILV